MSLYKPASALTLRTRRIAAHRCVECGEKLRPTDPFKMCQDCRAYMRDYNHERGAGLIRVRTRPEHESPKWAELEQKLERCACGLLVPCNACLPSIYELASSRRGGPTYPTGGP